MALRALGLGLLAMVFIGCGGGVRLPAEVVQPARVPVRTFPRIVVSAGDATSGLVADSLATHLMGGPSRVRRMNASEVDRLRRDRRMPPATVVLEVEAMVQERPMPPWMRRDPFMCGPYGCYDRRRPFMDEVGGLDARLTLRVREGSTGRLLQEVSIDASDSGGDPMGMRMRTIQELSRRARAMVDERREQVSVHLFGADDPEATRAIDELREGEWRRGRRRLERLVRSEVVRTWPREARARLLHDLGQARRFDPTEPPEERLASAERALRAAYRMHQDPALARTLSELQAQRRDGALLREQREATSHNFSLGAGLATPEPPPAYR